MAWWSARLKLQGVRLTMCKFPTLSSPTHLLIKVFFVDIARETKVADFEKLIFAHQHVATVIYLKRRREAEYVEIALLSLDDPLYL